MDKLLRQRLVGTSIIVILAVIFLPIIFNGAGIKKTTSTTTTELPLPQGAVSIYEAKPAPEIKTEPVTANQDLEQISSNSITQLELPPIIDVATNKNPVKATPKPAIKDKPVAKIVKAKPVAKVSTKEKPAAKNIAKNKPEPKPNKAVPKGAWQIQVGSFGNLNNANKLAGELAGHGFASRVISEPKRNLHKVLIVGFASEAKAKRAQQQLQKYYKDQTLIQKN